MEYRLQDAVNFTAKQALSLIRVFHEIVDFLL